MADTLEKKSKKTRNKVFSLFIVITLFLMGTISYGVYWAFFDMSRLPIGEYLRGETSPNGSYTLNIYRSNGGATSSYALRGELIDNERKGKSKNIYWNVGEDDADIRWIDEDTVEINEKALTVPHEIFDFRNQ